MTNQCEWYVYPAYSGGLDRHFVALLHLSGIYYSLLSLELVPLASTCAISNCHLVFEAIVAEDFAAYAAHQNPVLVAVRALCSTRRHAGKGWANRNAWEKSKRV